MANNMRTNVLGWTSFAALLLMAVGLFQTVVGFTALLNDQWLAEVGGRLLLLDLTAWGWVHLVLGIVTLVVGSGLFNGSVWARAGAVVLVMLTFFAQFAFLSVYPVWSVIIMVAGLMVLYGLTVRGEDV